MVLNIRQILIMLPIVLLAACSNKNSQKNSPPESNFQMKGKMTNSHGETLYFEHMTTTTVNVIDTVKLDEKGEFTLKENIKETGFYRVKISNNNLSTFIFSPGESVEFTADVNNMVNTYSVKGSKESELLMEINKVSVRNFRQRDSIQQAFQRYINDGKSKTQEQIDAIKSAAEVEFNQLISNYDKYMLDFVEKHNTAFASLAAIQQLKMEDHLEAYVKLDQSLYAKYPQSEYVSSFHNMVSSVSAMTIGGKAPEIVMNSPDGKAIALSSLKGKVVLIDFWASWCGPCRMENPNVVAAYDKYKDKGFDIFSVSLDKDVSRWQQAIEKDNLSWKSHVSDLKSWQSPVVQQYGFNGIPYNVLIDKEGKIIAKNLRGEDLHKALGNIFGN